MSEIPIDARILREQFLADQREQEARKAMEKGGPRGRNSYEDIRKPMRAKEVQRYARSLGFSIEEGRGRHGVHIVAPNGSECPLPVHGGGKTLATGTQRSIVNFIQQNGIYQT